MTAQTPVREFVRTSSSLSLSVHELVGEAAGVEVGGYEATNLATLKLQDAQAAVGDCIFLEAPSVVHSRARARLSHRDRT